MSDGQRRTLTDRVGVEHLGDTSSDSLVHKLDPTFLEFVLSVLLLEPLLG